MPAVGTTCHHQRGKSWKRGKRSKDNIMGHAVPSLFEICAVKHMGHLSIRLSCSISCTDDMDQLPLLFICTTILHHGSPSSFNLSANKVTSVQSYQFVFTAKKNWLFKIHSVYCGCTDSCHEWFAWALKSDCIQQPEKNSASILYSLQIRTALILEYPWTLESICHQLREKKTCCMRS